MKFSQTMTKRINNIKAELVKLFKEFKAETMIMECHLDNNDIPKGLTKEQYKKIIRERNNLINRDTVDRLFLQKMGILKTTTKNRKLAIQSKRENTPSD
jgi:hypothetical protein